jgi:hypothetical protein
MPATLTKEWSGRTSVPEDIRPCRDLCFRLSQITWRTSVVHHLTEDKNKHDRV